MYSLHSTFLFLETLNTVQFTLYISVFRDTAQCTVYTVHFCFLDKEFTVKPNHLGAMCSLQQDQIGEGILVSAKVKGIPVSAKV